MSLAEEEIKRSKELDPDPTPVILLTPGDALPVSRTPTPLPQTLPKSAIKPESLQPKAQHTELVQKLFNSLNIADREDPEGQYSLAFCYERGINVKQDFKKAAGLYELAAKNGHTMAPFKLFKLGVMYERGINVPKDRKQAVQYYKVTSRQGSKEDKIKSFYRLARCYQEHAKEKKSIPGITKYATIASTYYKKYCHSVKGKDVAKKMHKACERLSEIAAEQRSKTAYDCIIEICSSKPECSSKIYHYLSIAAQVDNPLAENANPWALNTLGGWLETLVIPKDPEKAVRYYERAVNLGDAIAAYNLARCYRYGIGVKQDDILARKYFELAAERGDALAQNECGLLYEKNKDLKRAVRFYRLAAKQGFHQAQYNLAGCYDQGRGVEKDLKEAVRWYTLAAGKGDIDAQFALGVCYEKGGYGVDKDLKQAIYYYGLVAAKDHTAAQFKLGNCYEGYGGEKDIEQAAKYYGLAAAKGHPEAQFNLGNCYEYGVGVVQSLSYAVSLYKLAADGGYSVAQRYLGSHYLTGWPEAELEENLDEAIRYLGLSAQQGDVEAKKKLDELAAKTKPTLWLSFDSLFGSANKKPPGSSPPKIRVSDKLPTSTDKPTV